MTIEGSSTPPIDLEPKDVDYDEFKQYETITPIRPLEVQAQPEQPKAEIPAGHMVISDMTREQLINSVTNLATAYNQMKEEVAKARKTLAEMRTIWNDPKQIKIRFHQLKGK